MMSVFICIIINPSSIFIMHHLSYFYLQEKKGLIYISEDGPTKDTVFGEKYNNNNILKTQ